MSNYFDLTLESDRFQLLPNQLTQTLGVRALAGNDVILGSSDSETIYGNGGDDFLFGAAGSDYLSGGKGSDQLEGGLGNDTLSGDFGNDLLWGNEGSDTFIFRKANATFSGQFGIIRQEDFFLFPNPIVDARPAALIVDFNAQEGDIIVLSDGLKRTDINLELRFAFLPTFPSYGISGLPDIRPNEPMPRITPVTVIREIFGNNILGIVSDRTPEQLNIQFV
jgi:serralysin